MEFIKAPSENLDDDAFRRQRDPSVMLPLEQAQEPSLRKMTTEIYIEEENHKKSFWNGTYMNRIFPKI